MFYHRNLALNGLYPGVTSIRSISNMGMFETTVIIEPVKSSGGGYVPVAKGEKPDRYRVTIRVIVNGKKYEETYIVDDHEARIMANVHGVMIFTEDVVMVAVNGVQVINEDEVRVIASYAPK